MHPVARTLLLTALGAAACVFYFVGWRNPSPTHQFWVEIEVTSSQIGTAQLFFDSGSSYHEAASARRTIDTVETRIPLRFPIAEGSYRALRFDPLDRDGTIRIHALRVHEASGSPVRSVSVSTAVAGPQISSLVPSADGLIVTLEPAAVDPQLEFPLSPVVTLQSSRGQWWRAHVLPPVLAFVLLAIAASRFAGMAERPFSRAKQIALCVATFLVVWTARLALIGQFGTDLPYWDQWDKEAARTIVPWVEQHAFWRNLFDSFNEHRVVPTAALNLLLAQAFAVWDARVQCIVNAALHASFVSLVVLWLMRNTSARAASLGAALLTTCTSLPLAWENILGGFQSQFTFLALFSILAIAGLLQSNPFSARWFLALSSGALAIISMGSGFVWAVAVAFVALARAFRGEATRAVTGAALVVSALALGAGLWLRTPVPGLHTLHAHSVAELLVYAARCLSWPFHSIPALCLILWLPWVVLLVRRIQGAIPAESRSSTDVLLAIGAWIVLQAAAVAYGRGGSGSLLPSRYVDVFALGPLVNLACLAIGTRTRTPALAGTYAAAIVIGALGAAAQALAEPIPARSRDYKAYVTSVRDFVRTDDLETFSRRPVPVPQAEFIANILRHPVIRPVLPMSVRPTSIPPLVSVYALHLSDAARPLLVASIAILVLIFLWTSSERRHPVAA